MCGVCALWYVHSYTLCVCLCQLLAFRSQRGCNGVRKLLAQKWLAGTHAGAKAFLLPAPLQIITTTEAMLNF